MAIGFGEILHGVRGADRARRHRGEVAVAILLWLLLTVARLTAWTVRQSWERPVAFLIGCLSMLAAIGITPLAGEVTVLTLSSGYYLLRLRWFDRLPGVGAPRRESILLTLSSVTWRHARFVYRCWRLKRDFPAAAEILKLTSTVTGEPKKVRRLTVHSPTRVSAAVSTRHTGGQHALKMADPELLRGVTSQLDLRSVTCEEVRGRSSIAKFTFYWASRVDEIQPLTELPKPQNGWAMFGVGEDDRPVGLRLDVSTLGVGESRSGKSNAFWVMVCSALEQARKPDGEPVLFWVIDLAQTEFPALKPLAAYYVSGQNDARGMLNKLKQEAGRRAAVMAERGWRKMKPSGEFPRIILIIDELLVLVSRKLSPEDAKSNEALLYTILTQFAKYGIVVWCGTQAGKVEIVGGARDFFQQRFCMSSASKHMTDAALGDQANALGAECHALMVPQDAGIGWLRDHERSGFRKFRAMLATDDEIEQIGMGLLPVALSKRRSHLPQRWRRDKRPGWVYELWTRPDENNYRHLLYVGSTVAEDPSTRFRKHLAGGDAKPWAVEVDDQWVKVKKYRRIAAARRAEQRQIRRRNPRENDVRYDGERETVDAH